jgi:hypothetical protein
MREDLFLYQLTRLFSAVLAYIDEDFRSDVTLSISKIVFLLSLYLSRDYIGHRKINGSSIL